MSGAVEIELRVNGVSLDEWNRRREHERQDDRIEQIRRECEIIDGAYADLTAEMNGRIVTDYLHGRSKSAEPIVQYPHCDKWVLHAPGERAYCDRHQDWQLARLRLRISFTGSTQPDDQWATRPCPATLFRPVEKIHRWGGNAPLQEDEEFGDGFYRGPTYVA